MASLTQRLLISNGATDTRGYVDTGRPTAQDANPGIFEQIDLFGRPIARVSA